MAVAGVNESRCGLRCVSHQPAAFGQGAAQGFIAAVPHVRAAAVGQGVRLRRADGDIDIEQRLEFFAGGGQERLIAGDADRQPSLLTGGVDPILQTGKGGGIGGPGIAAAFAAGAETQRQQQRQRGAQDSFHRGYLLAEPPGRAAVVTAIIAEMAYPVKSRRRTGLHRTFG